MWRRHHCQREPCYSPWRIHIIWSMVAKPWRHHPIITQGILARFLFLPRWFWASVWLVGARPSESWVAMTANAVHRTALRSASTLPRCCDAMTSDVVTCVLIGSASTLPHCCDAMSSDAVVCAALSGASTLLRCCGAQTGDTVNCAALCSVSILLRCCGAHCTVLCTALIIRARATSGSCRHTPRAVKGDGL